jgi:hypothetical protein
MCELPVTIRRHTNYRDRGILLTRKGTIDIEKSKDLTSRVATTIDYELISKLPLDAVAEHLKRLSGPEEG